MYYLVNGDFGQNHDISPPYLFTGNRTGVNNNQGGNLEDSIYFVEDFDVFLEYVKKIKHPDKLVWPKKPLKPYQKVMGQANHTVKRMAVVIARLKKKVKDLMHEIETVPADKFPLEREELEARLNFLDNRCFLLIAERNQEIRKQFAQDPKFADVVQKRYVGVASSGKAFYLDIPALDETFKGINALLNNALGENEDDYEIDITDYNLI